MTRDDHPGFEPPQMPRPEESRPLQDRTGPDRDHDAEPSTDEIVVRPTDPAPSRSRWLLVGGAALAVLVLIGALLVWGPGSPLGPSDGGTPGASSPPSATAPQPPVLPERFDTFTRQPDSTGPTASSTEDDDLAVATATYTQNGQPSVLLIAARPVDDMEQFLLSLGAGRMTPTGSGVCASYDEVPLCGVAVDGVGWAVSPLADQDGAELVRIATLAAEAG